ncbi:GumC family protein [Muricoccus aerilatus]|uniref:GumC family protein n=1 Tax=Muricoccus aerilatus TaxID=452982 RepID=UPI0005C1D636|nr:hypothetical protein [Roseomonas aerilata]
MSAPLALPSPKEVSLGHEGSSHELAAYLPQARGARPSLSVSDLLITLVLRLPWVVLAFLLPAALGIALALLLPTRHTAEAVMMVLTSRETAGAPDLSGFGPNVVSVEMQKAVRAETEILGSEEVLRRAIERVGLERLPGPPAEGGGTEAGLRLAAAAETLRRSLRTDADATSNILRVRLSLSDRALAIEALGAIVDAYLDRRAELFSESSSRLLVAELDRTRDRLREVEAGIGQVKARYGIVDISTEMNLLAGRLDAIVRREDALREQEVQTSAQLASAEQRLSAQPTRVYASSEATNAVSGDEVRSTFTRLLQERERMVAQYAPGWPGLADLDQRIAAARAALREAGRNTFQTTREVRNPVLDQLAGRVASLQVEKDAISRQLAEVGRQRQAAEVRGAELVGADAQLRELSRQREGMEVIVRQLITREAGARVEEDNRRQRSASINIVQPPTAPLRGTSLRRPVAAGSVVAGLAAASLLLLLLTLTRRSFATPQEAERGLDLPPLAHFGSLRPAAEGMKRMPEVADFVAMLLDVRVVGRRPCLVQFAAAGGEDGREELGRSIALEYARRTGTDTLLIDLQTDGRSQLAALGSQPMEVERVPGHLLVFNTVVPNLWVSFDAGSSFLMDPSVTIEGTRNLLDKLRNSFDAVVVIGPDDDDSYAVRRLTALMDANVIVVRGERTRADRALALRDRVLNSGGTLLGFVYTGYRRVLPRALAGFA